MPGDVDQSLSDVKDAIENLNNLFEERLKILRLEGADEDDLSGLEKGILAMKDAGRIYLTWTDHFIGRLNEAEGLDPLID